MNEHAADIRVQEGHPPPAPSGGGRGRWKAGGLFVAAAMLVAAAASVIHRIASHPLSCLSPSRPGHAGRFAASCDTDAVCSFMYSFRRECFAGRINLEFYEFTCLFFSGQTAEMAV